MNLTTRYIVGDVFDVLRSLDSGSVDLVMTSPPFLALRSYLPADHPDKAKEIGSETTPGEFIDTMIAVVEECRRVLTPYGSLVFELGDTYSGSGGAGGDYNKGGLRDGAPKFGGSGKLARYGDERGNPDGMRDTTFSGANTRTGSGNGWPLDKSLTGIPTLFAWSLAYGRNLLNPEHETEQWRIRNVVAWCRPNPPVGELSDKCRPATSYLTVATMARDRWFDMDAVRTPSQDTRPRNTNGPKALAADEEETKSHFDTRTTNPAGAPLLDYWVIPTQPYSGSHYATYPEELARRVILLMCPERVCTECGEPSRRIVERESAGVGFKKSRENLHDQPPSTGFYESHRETVGWTDCGHNAWRPGIVLDPFAGSGTTLRMALGNGRSSIGIDIDSRNAELALQRVGPLYMDVEYL